MPFVYDRETRAAVDKERNITVSQSLGTWADKFPVVLKFKYASPELAFEFGAVYHKENRKIIKDGKEVEHSVGIAIDVLEGSMKNGGIGRPKHRPSHPLSPEKFSEVKESVKEGIFVLCAQRAEDGSLLVPEFQVNFVAHAKSSTRTPIPPKQP